MSLHLLVSQSLLAPTWEFVVMDLDHLYLCYVVIRWVLGKSWKCLCPRQKASRADAEDIFRSRCFSVPDLSSCLFAICT